MKLILFVILLPAHFVLSIGYWQGSLILEQHYYEWLDALVMDCYRGKVWILGLLK